MLLISAFRIMPDRAFAAEEKNEKRHFIFLVHGIGGNKTHFGFMKEALWNVLNDEDDATSYIIRDFEYDTENDEKKPFDFAKDFSRELESLLDRNKGINENDKISLIMHSQGGLIGSIWLFQSLNDNFDFSPQYVRHLDSFVTLATPFWGAKMALLGSAVSQLASYLHVNFDIPFGDRQLEEMSFGSDTIFEFREALLDDKQSKNFKFIKNNVRMLNIAAIAKALDLMALSQNLWVKIGY
ncbi:MAG: hypothetical protein KAR05_03695 [Candidatus Omnitrophica bacterium]|nr:hypothetical protein [Candidatus Omnitrophota bacterium]